MAEWLPLVLGALSGLALGLTGAGGSLLALPLLVYGLGLPFVQAVPVSLLAVSASAALGTAVAWRNRVVRWRAALVMAAFGALLTPLGMWMSARVPEAALTFLFALVAVWVAMRLWRQANQDPSAARVVRAHVIDVPSPTPVPCSVDPDTGRLRWNRRCF